MNIVSTLVGVSIMGVAAPGIMDMTLAPAIAQKRATNFSQAEAQAVTFSASYEGGVFAPENTETCTAVEIGPLAYEVTCTSGKGQFKQDVSRSFRLKPEGTSYTNPDRQFAWETPAEFSHVECPVNDPWGVGWYNEHLAAGHMKACLPAPTWSEARYKESNPDDWLFDLSDWGYGRHPDY